MKVSTFKNGSTPEKFTEVDRQDYKFKLRNILSVFLKSNKKRIEKVAQLLIHFNQIKKPYGTLSHNSPILTSAVDRLSCKWFWYWHIFGSGCNVSRRWCAVSINSFYTECILYYRVGRYLIVYPIRNVTSRSW